MKIDRNRCRQTEIDSEIERKRQKLMEIHENKWKWIEIIRKR